MTRQQLENDIKRALIDTWLSADNNTLTEAQRTIAEQHVQRLALGVANAVDAYVAMELMRLKEFLTASGAYTGHFIPTITYDPEDPLLGTGLGTREEIVTIDPGTIRTYTPSSG